MPTDPVFGIHISRQAGDFGIAGDHNKDARWLSLFANVLGAITESGFLHNSQPVIDTDGYIVPQTIIGQIEGLPIFMTDELQQTGVAEDGTTRSLVDTALTQEQSFWDGAWIVFTSGANNGQVRQVTRFDAASTSLQWEEPLEEPVRNGDTFFVTFFYIEDLLVNGERHVFAAGRRRPIYWAAADRIYSPARFYARSSPDKLTGEVYLGVVTVEDGAITDIDQSAGDFWLRPHGAAVHILSGEIETEEIEPEGSLTVTIEHDPLILFGPISVSVPSPHEIVVTEWHKPDRFSVVVTNKGASGTSIPITWERVGKRA